MNDSPAVVGNKDNLIADHYVQKLTALVEHNIGVYANNIPDVHFKHINEIPEMERVGRQRHKALGLMQEIATELVKRVHVLRKRDLELRTRPGVETLAADFWECNCVSGYIHHKSLQKCGGCRTDLDEAPDARLSEVLEMLSKNPRIDWGTESDD